ARSRRRRSGSSARSTAARSSWRTSTERAPHSFPARLPSRRPGLFRGLTRARAGGKLPPSPPPSPMQYRFTASIESSGSGGAYVTIPFDVEAAFGEKRPKVHATFDGLPYRGTLAQMGGPDHV